MELISVLVLTYLAGGTQIERELSLPHASCLQAERTISRAIQGPSSGRPRVEMHNGKFAPVVSVHCLPACMADGNAEIALLAEAEG